MTACRHDAFGGRGQNRRLGLAMDMRRRPSEIAAPPRTIQKMMAFVASIGFRRAV
jgi:hypothetical protein